MQKVHRWSAFLSKTTVGKISKKSDMSQTDTFKTSIYKTTLSKMSNYNFKQKLGMSCFLRKFSTVYMVLPLNSPLIRSQEQLGVARVVAWVERDERARGSMNAGPHPSLGAGSNAPAI